MKGFLVPAIFSLCLVAPSVTAGDKAGVSDEGRDLYIRICRACHGPRGDGNGPSAAFLNSRPADFTNHDFRKSNVFARISTAVRNGKGDMPSFNLGPREIRAIFNYIRDYLMVPATADEKKR